MANAINLQELEQELMRTKAMFEQWSTSVLATAQDCKATHLAQMKANKGEVAALTERYQRAEKQAAQVRQQMTQDIQHEEALQQTADALVSEQQALQKRLQQMQQELGADSQAVQQLEAEVSNKRREVKLRLANFESLHNTYRDCLGLTLRSQEGELYFEFTQIDEQEPERPFGFALQVDGLDRYTVTRCSPDIGSRKQLEQQLLVGRQDLPGFVRAMRQQFQQMSIPAPAAGGT